VLENSKRQFPYKFPETISCLGSYWDEHQYCLCPIGQRISVFKSHHLNKHEDREWQLECAPIQAKLYIPSKDSNESAVLKFSIVWCIWEVFLWANQKTNIRVSIHGWVWSLNRGGVMTTRLLTSYYYSVNHQSGSQRNTVSKLSDIFLYIKMCRRLSHLIWGIFHRSKIFFWSYECRKVGHSALAEQPICILRIRS
jgi:hypothetical protein